MRKKEPFVKKRLTFRILRDKMEYAIWIDERKARKTSLTRERLTWRTRFLDAENKSLITRECLLLAQLIYRLV